MPNGGIVKTETLIKGKIMSFDETKGFGFITDSESKESIFVHVNDSKEPLKVGCWVKLETKKGIKELKAVNVKPI